MIARDLAAFQSIIRRRALHPCRRATPHPNARHEEHRRERAPTALEPSCDCTDTPRCVRLSAASDAGRIIPRDCAASRSAIGAAAPHPTPQRNAGDLAGPGVRIVPAPSGQLPCPRLDRCRARLTRDRMGRNIEQSRPTIERPMPTPTRSAASDCQPAVHAHRPPGACQPVRSSVATDARLDGDLETGDSAVSRELRCGRVAGKDVVNVTFRAAVRVSSSLAVARSASSLMSSPSGNIGHPRSRAMLPICCQQEDQLCIVAGHRLGADESACKPDPVPLRRCRRTGGDHPSGATIAGDLGAVYPQARAGSPRTPALAPPPRGVVTVLTLLRVGFAEPRRSPAALVVSYTTVSPLPPGSRREAVCSLWHCPAGCPGWALPTTLPCGVRTFLDTSMRGGAAAARPARPPTTSVAARR